MLEALSTLRRAKTSRCSSWDRSGRNDDSWCIAAGSTCVLADIKGPGCITHIWMTQNKNYRECLVKITFDNASAPSVLVPLGDFFGLGNGFVNSYQSLLFSASTNKHSVLNGGCALDCYAPMPFRERALVELVNESDVNHIQYFYIDYETYESVQDDNMGYFHAEFRRANPFGGWGHEIAVNTPECNIANKERLAWDNNYVILETKGRGHYIGCNISVTNLQGNWWGEGDDMIWVDGYKWPPDLHGTGSEDYLSQAWGMQPNAFLRNGSSIFEQNTMKGSSLIPGENGGYQTSYVHHLENPVHFTKEIKVTIEHGHGNHLRNEMSSVAYWYADRPCAACPVPPLIKRLPILRDEDGGWTIDANRQTDSREIVLNDEMKLLKAQWASNECNPRKLEEEFEPVSLSGWEWAGPFSVNASPDLAPDLVSAFKPEDGLAENERSASEPGLWKPCGEIKKGLIDFARWIDCTSKQCICYARLKVESKGNAAVPMALRLDYFARLWINGQEINLNRVDMAPPSAPIHFTATLKEGENEVLIKVHPGSLGHAFILNVGKTR